MDFPPRDLALRLPPSQLAGYLLVQVVTAWRRDKKPFAFSSALPGDARQDEDLRVAYAEGWGWLVREGLIVPDQNPFLLSPSPNMVPSRRARELDSLAAFERLVRGGLIPNHLLDERVQLAAESDFFAGQNDTAVLKALREVEIAVRKAANLPDTSYGVPLMMEAFNESRGVLRDVTAVEAERKALPQLFAAPFALYSNSTRHRDVGLTPEKTIEILVIASHLLRVVEERSARSPDPDA